MFTCMPREQVEKTSYSVGPAELPPRHRRRKRPQQQHGGLQQPSVGLPGRGMRHRAKGGMRAWHQQQGAAQGAQVQQGIAADRQRGS